MAIAAASASTALIHMMEQPRAFLFAVVAALVLHLLFTFLAVYASRPQHPVMPAAIVGVVAPATASRAGGAQEALLAVRKLVVADARPDDRGSHRTMPDGAHHHPAAIKKWVIVGVVIAVVAVVLGALAVGVYRLCVRKRRVARELPLRAPWSPPSVQRPQTPAEPQGPCRIHFSAFLRFRRTNF